MDFRFNAHDARTGDYLFALPRPAQAQIGDVFGDRGTLEVTYSAKQARAMDLPTFVEVRMQVQHDGGQWEDVGPALVRLGGSHEDTDQAGMRSVQFVGREWLLGRARVSAGDSGTELIDGKRPFYQASAGEIMRTLLLEAKDRGAAAGIDLGGFTASRDTAGREWSERVTIYYSPGLPIGDVLQNLVDQGLCDYRMVGRTLELYEPETTLGRDLTTGNNPVRVHGAITEAPVKYSLEDLANSALLIGEDNFEIEVDNPSAPDDYGRLEVTIEQGGVNQEGTARTLIDAELQRGSREIREITRTQHAAGARALPYRDYRCGDFVQVYDQGAWERYRVREIQLVLDGDGWTVHTVLNDRLQELLLRLAKKTNGIVNGSRGSGGDGTRPAPPAKPGVEPAAPQGLVIDQQVYLDNAGTARGVIEAGWGEVTQSTRGLAIDIGGYELWWRENATFAIWQRATATGGDTEVAYSPVVLTDGDGEPMEYQWRVRAVAQESARPGPFSSIVTLTMTQDTTPPPPPSLPIVETGFRIVTVEWDGLDEDGQAMPRDFAWTRIYTAASEDMAGARRVGSLGHPGSWNSDTLPADVPVWVALTAVDRVGNESPMTPAVSVTPRQLVDDEAIRDELDRIEDDYQDAISDLQQDIENIVIDEQGAVTYWLPSAPDETTDPAPKRGDLWFDTSDGSKLHRHDGQEWVSAQDGRIQTIQDAHDDLETELNEVRQTADGKNRTYYQSTMPSASSNPPPRSGDLWFNTANGFRLHRHNGTTFIAVDDARISALQDDVENIDISGPLSEARDEWLQDAAADAQQKAQNAANSAEAAAKAYADAVATGAVEGELEGLQDYADNAAEQARQAAITAAIAEARVIANEARDEALSAALDADLVLSQSIAEFENDLDLVRQSADGKNSITWSPSVASGPGESGDTWFRTSGNNIIGYWRHNGSSWVSMSVDPVVIPNLDAGKITSGYLDAARIKAGTITADVLGVGDFTNYVRDINRASAREFMVRLGEHGQYAMVNAPDIAPGGEVAPWLWQQTAGTGFAARTLAEPLTVTPGEKIHLSFEARRNGASTPIRLNLWVQDSQGNNVAWDLASASATAPSSAPDGEWQSYSGSVTIPATGYRVVPQLKRNANGDTAGGWYVTNIAVRRMTGSTLIEDGAITTDKIQAGAVGATAIAAESIDASKIVAGGIQADHILVPGTVGGTLIQDGAVTTSKIEAGAITAQSGIIASLDAGTITFGQMEGARIKAGTITADKLLIGAPDNLIIDPMWANPEENWELPLGATLGEETLPGGAQDRVLTIVAGGDHRAAVATPYKAPAPGRYLFRVWVRVNSFTPRSDALPSHDAVTFVLETVRGGSTSWPTPIAVKVSDMDAMVGEWVQLSGMVNLSTGGIPEYVVPRFMTRAIYDGGTTSFYRPEIIPQMGSTLIEDGAVTTDKIAVGAITADSGVVGSLDAGTITVGHMSGERISANSLDASRVVVGDSVTGTLIQDGAISTDKLTANAVTAGKIAALAITADKIAANAIQADKIAAGAIDGKMITGATIRTNATGARIVLNTQGLEAFDQNGDYTFWVNATTGAVDITGNLTQRNPYGRAVFGPTLYSGQNDIGPALGFPVTGTTYFGPAGIYARESSTDGKPELHLQGPHVSNTQGSTLDLAAGDSTKSSIFQRQYGSGNASYVSLANGGDAVVQARGDAYLRSTGTSGGAKSWLRANADGSIYVASSSGSSAYIDANTSTGGVYIRKRNAAGDTTSSFIRVDNNGVTINPGGTTGGRQIFLSGNNVTMQTIPTNTGAVPIGITSGRIHQMPSSRRFKVAEEKMFHDGDQLEDKLLSVDPKTWVDRTSAERVADYMTAVALGEDPGDDLADCGTLDRIPGVMAEDMHDAGLELFVRYEDGEPHSVFYDRIGPALIPIIRRLRDRVDALESMIGATP